jgi:hypothetical protein
MSVINFQLLVMTLDAKFVLFFVLFHNAEDLGTPDSGIGDGAFASPEEKARQHEEWKQELIKVSGESGTERTRFFFFQCKEIE